MHVRCLLEESNNKNKYENIDLAVQIADSRSPSNAHAKKRKISQTSTYVYKRLKDKYFSVELKTYKKSLELLINSILFHIVLQ